MYDLPKNVHVVSMIPVCLFMCVYVGSNFLIYEFESWITCVFSPHVVSLRDLAYYVVG